MEGREPPLVDVVAAAILDGSDVDWQTASDAPPEDRDLMDEFRLVASVAEVFRGRSGSTASSVIAAGNDPIREWGRLQVIDRIGSGSFGEVYRAWDPDLDRDVALKVWRDGPDAGPGSDARPIEEARLLARVRHPNVVSVYGAQRIGNRVGLWMELVDGRTLERMLRDGHRFSPREIADIGEQLSAALAAVHHEGVLHRDVKVHNVMLTTDGRVVLMDFGAGSGRGAPLAPALTGTPLYLAPEVLNGERPSPAADVYSLGVLLYHLATGVYPVQASSLPELRQAHGRGDSVPLLSVRREFPQPLAAIIDRAVATPDRRYTSADALGAGLRAYARPSPLRRWWIAGAAALAAAAVLLAGATFGGGPFRSATARTAAVPAPAGIPAIAVLPLRNLAGAPEGDDFADGLTDEIIRNLAAIDGLSVRSSTSSFAFKGRPLDARNIGRELNADYLIEGSILRADGRLRINAQLIRVAGDVPLWAERFDRDVDDVFQIQDEISRAIVDKLRLALGRGQRRYQTDVNAYGLYLKARALNQRRGTEAARAATELFSDVIARDSSFAPAHAGLALAYAVMSTSYDGPAFARTLPLIRQAAVRSLELDPLLAEAHAAMGELHAREHNWADSLRAFRRAIELNPSITEQHTMFVQSTLIPLGRLEEADQVLAQARDADPLSLNVLRQIAVLRIVQGHYDDAVELMQQVRAVDPDFPFADLMLARALTFGGRLEEALPIWEHRMRQSVAHGRDQRGVQYWMAPAYVMNGRRDEVESWPVGQDAYPYRQAIIHAALGNTDAALDALDRVATFEPQRLGYILRCPEMASLRDDPRLARIRARLALPA